MYASLLTQGCPCCLGWSGSARRSTGFKAEVVARAAPARAVVRQERLVLFGGTIVDPRSGALISGKSVLVNNGVIVALEEGAGTETAGQRIDATGKFICPATMTCTATCWS